MVVPDGDVIATVDEHAGNECVYEVFVGVAPAQVPGTFTPLQHGRGVGGQNGEFPETRFSA